MPKIVPGLLVEDCLGGIELNIIGSAEALPILCVSDFCEY